MRFEAKLQCFNRRILFYLWTLFTPVDFFFYKRKFIVYFRGNFFHLWKVPPHFGAVYASLWSALSECPPDVQHPSKTRLKAWKTLRALPLKSHPFLKKWGKTLKGKTSFSLLQTKIYLQKINFLKYYEWIDKYQSYCICKTNHL